MSANLVQEYVSFLLQEFSRSELRMVARAYRGQNVEELIEACDELIRGNKRGLRYKAELLRKELCIACPGKAERIGVITEQDVFAVSKILSECDSVDAFIERM